VIALTDAAVKNLLQTRFNMPAIYGDTSTAMMERGDERFQLPTGFVDESGNLNPKVKFPFCVWNREAGAIDTTRYFDAQARYGVDTGIRSEDRTKARFVKLIPMNYPYAIDYYVASVAQSTRIEKLYWGLHVNYPLLIDFPPASDERLHTLFARIIELGGFTPPKTDQMYAKGRYYTGTMNFHVSTNIVEGIDIPLVQKVIIDTYDHNGLDQLDSYSYDEKIWRN
jgi:hypothetical protein